ncbi:hypothetical protein SUGI_0844820 [Cryptomeria japonica]|nr:hypothetical protein SUGI_0844820 [Cryptomeria japonica]
MGWLLALNWRGREVWRKSETRADLPSWRMASQSHEDGRENKQEWCEERDKRRQWVDLLGYRNFLENAIGCWDVQNIFNGSTQDLIKCNCGRFNGQFLEFLPRNIVQHEVYCRGDSGLLQVQEMEMIKQYTRNKPRQRRKQIEQSVTPPTLGSFVQYVDATYSREKSFAITCTSNFSISKFSAFFLMMSLLADHITPNSKCLYTTVTLFLISFSEFLLKPLEQTNLFNNITSKFDVDVAIS